MSMVTQEQLQAAIAGGAVYGSNSNGEYLKFGNGVMIAWKSFTHSALGSTGNANIGTYGWSFYYGVDAVTFPLAFIAAPTVTASAGSGMGVPQAVTASGFNANVYSYVTTEQSYHWIAIGRWK